MERIRITKKLIIVAIVILITILAWAPWMDSWGLEKKFMKKQARVDGTIGEVITLNGTKEMVICDYKVSWLPFGRYVASCEGGYFVTFYGSVL